MTETQERPTRIENQGEPVPDDSFSVDTDQSGALAIGLMIAVVAMVALMTLALIVSIP